MQIQHADVYKTLETPETSLGLGNINIVTDSVSSRKVVMFDKNSPRAKALAAAIAKMIISDCQPFSLVSDPGFKNLMQIGELRYDFSNRALFSDEVIPEMYHNEREKVKESITKDIGNMVGRRGEITATFP